jgi:hypothetical protein
MPRRIWKVDGAGLNPESVTERCEGGICGGGGARARGGAEVRQLASLKQANNKDMEDIGGGSSRAGEGGWEEGGGGGGVVGPVEGRGRAHGGARGGVCVG